MNAYGVSRNMAQAAVVFALACAMPTDPAPTDPSASSEPSLEELNEIWREAVAASERSPAPAPTGVAPTLCQPPLIQMGETVRYHVTGVQPGQRARA